MNWFGAGVSILLGMGMTFASVLMWTYLGEVEKPGKILHAVFFAVLGVAVFCFRCAYWFVTGK